MLVMVSSPAQPGRDEQTNYQIIEERGGSDEFCAMRAGEEWPPRNKGDQHGRRGGGGKGGEEEGEGRV